MAERKQKTAKARAAVAGLGRRLRSLIPVSPIPPSWQRRLGRGRITAFVALVAGVLIYSVVGGSDQPAGVQPEGVSKKSLRSLSKLKLPERVAQVLMAPPGSLDKVTDAPPGSVFIRSVDWPGSAAGRELTARLSQGDGRTVPILATQQEGGAYRALSDLPPTAAAIEVGDTASPAVAEDTARETARSLRNHGFDLNLAPVADVAPLTSAIAGRAYSDETYVVSALVAAAIRGCEAEDLGCAPSHFPGLGATSADTASDPATVALDPAALRSRDLPPFRAAFDGGAPAVVLSLAFYAAYDPVTPGALSPQIASDLLRGELGFKGVAITDDLSSGAITAGQGAPEAAVAALTAGADMVFISEPAQAAQAYEAILTAARAGLIAPDRLDTAVARVLELKRKLGVG